MFTKRRNIEQPHKHASQSQIPEKKTSSFLINLDEPIFKRKSICVITSVVVCLNTPWVNRFLPQNWDNGCKSTPHSLCWWPVQHPQSFAFSSYCCSSDKPFPNGSNMSLSSPQAGSQWSAFPLSITVRFQEWINNSAADESHSTLFSQPMPTFTSLHFCNTTRTFLLYFHQMPNSKEIKSPAKDFTIFVNTEWHF